ncbi:succinate dehydrogenase assembly factor 2 [Methylobacter sp. S3L5C]|uniref:FAD assembly factor SdhE n=1 Tax=Methylobacter sp. S3L5C TaxID=2839024 RepID=UPI001FABD911|nr:succinate dehydrogenase assembly factor 2 [Methylobacter sp. S3L5C]UOA07471.1 succinate dehydrogenase assembly factor 2 [Methylobacter sp. S3L5C]
MKQLAKLRWQCRRGTKELDFLLLRYLDAGYILADDEEKARFVELLSYEDDQLIDILMGDLKVDAQPMKALIAKIRSTG